MLFYLCMQIHRSWSTLCTEAYLLPYAGMSLTVENAGPHSLLSPNTRLQGRGGREILPSRLHGEIRTRDSRKMGPLDLVKLTALMERSRGRPETRVGLIDGPVAIGHPDLAAENIREVPGRLRGRCALADSAACGHGTFVAGILAGKRGSAAPAICPDCSLLVRPIFAETVSGTELLPDATPQELAAAIIDCVDAGAHVVNLSLALDRSSSRGE